MQTNINYLSLRRNLGILGLVLPFVLVAGNFFTFESSISRFYYTQTIVVFTGVLCAFGLFLLSYKGYDKADEFISDNHLTNLGGIFAILVALVPTSFPGHEHMVPNGHDNLAIAGVHFFCAASFFLLMGWMSVFNFTRGDTTDPGKRKRNVVYRICGYGLWIVIALIGILKLLRINLTGIDVFIGETIGLVLFGTSWLVKGRAMKKIQVI